MLCMCNSVNASRLYSLYSPICCLRPLHLINAPGVIFDVALIHGPLPTINQHKLFLFTLTVIKTLSHIVTQAYFYRSNENWHQGKAGQVHQLKEVLLYLYIYSLLSLSLFFSPSLSKWTGTHKVLCEWLILVLILHKA